MLNAEKFKGRILELADADYLFSVDRRDNKIKACRVSECTECLLNSGNCAHSRTKWLLSEYKEPIKLSRFEYSLLRHVYKLNHKYIARDKNGDISLYLDEPDKDLLTEIWHGKEYEFTLFNSLFKFVKWEDKKPTSIQDILDNCEVIEDDL